MWPPGLRRQVAALEDLVLAYGRQARALTGLVLDGVDQGRDVIAGRGGRALAALEEGDAGVVAAVDSLDGHIDDPLEGLADVSLAEQGARYLREHLRTATLVLG